MMVYKKLIWRLRQRRCWCGSYRMFKDCRMEIAGRSHSVDDFCYPCDVRGNRIAQ